MAAWRVQLVSLRRTWRGAFRDALANRRSFAVQAVVMIVNDLFWVLFWVIFFRQLGELRGWQLADVLILQAVLTTAGGIVLGLFNNTRRLASLISAGGLDEALALPVATLPYLLVRRIEPVNVGDIVFGIALFGIAGQPTLARAGAFVVAVVISATVLASFLVLVGSTAFVGGRSDIGELGFHSVVLFASYPIDVFGGAMRIMLFTLIPAGFITAAPTRFVRELEPSHAMGAAAFGVALTVVAVMAFQRGLGRYTSGAMWEAG